MYPRLFCVLSPLGTHIKRMLVRTILAYTPASHVVEHHTRSEPASDLSLNQTVWARALQDIKNLKRRKANITLNDIKRHQENCDKIA